MEFENKGHRLDQKSSAFQATLRAVDREFDRFRFGLLRFSVAGGDHSDSGYTKQDSSRGHETHPFLFDLILPYLATRSQGLIMAK